MDGYKFSGKNRTLKQGANFISFVIPKCYLILLHNYDLPKRRAATGGGSGRWEEGCSDGGSECSVWEEGREECPALLWDFRTPRKFASCAPRCSRYVDRQRRRKRVLAMPALCRHSRISLPVPWPPGLRSPDFFQALFGFPAPLAARSCLLYSNRRARRFFSDNKFIFLNLSGWFTCGPSKTAL